MSILSSVWQRWVRIALFIGNVQITVFLWLVYWILLPFWALPYKVFSDRLGLRGPDRARWIQRTPETDRLDSMRRQG